MKVGSRKLKRSAQDQDSRKKDKSVVVHLS